ncbi:MAG: hypothetical protein AAGJ35_13790, partial [Myxococcota bacterium]
TRPYGLDHPQGQQRLPSPPLLGIDCRACYVGGRQLCIVRIACNVVGRHVWSVRGVCNEVGRHL